MERSLWWEDPNNIDLEKLIRPLNPIQTFFLRIQVRDVLEETFSLPDKVRPDQKCSEEESVNQLNWEKIAKCVNEKCPDSTAHGPETYRKVWSRIWLTNESTVYIHDERLVYELLPKMLPESWMIFYNLGYDDNKRLYNVPLKTHESEFWRYSIQLYHHVAAQIDITNKDIIEIGCGRGGGAAHILQQFRPRTYIGMDVSKGNIEFCKRVHNYPGLSFVQGSAVKLPFPDNSCDVVFNVESSHSYPSMTDFVREVQRVLRPGGFLCFVDSRHKNEIENLKNDLVSTGLKKLNECDISVNVAEALAKFKDLIPSMLDHHRVKKNTAKRNAYEQLLFDLCNRWYPHFASRRYVYLSSVLQKTNPNKL